MKKTIKRISPVQLGKLLAAVYALFSVIFVPFLLIAVLTAPEGRGLSLVFCIVMPIIYIVLGFIGGIIGAFIYNIAAGWVGGIEIEIEE
jgi:ABC-type Co2+ transport system permease subunit